MAARPTLCLCLATFCCFASACGDAPLAAADAGGVMAGSEPVVSESDAAAAPDPEPEPREPVVLVEPVEPVEDEPVLDCPASLTTHPIVLAHGMGGFDHIGPMEYWVGVLEALEAIGAEVFVTQVDWLNGSDVRGEQLAAQLDDILADPCVDGVNLIGHSQGGLDARYVVNAMGYGDVVASITSVGTPHTGLWLSDVGLGLADGPQAAVLDGFAALFDFAWPAQGEDPDLTASLWWTSTEGLAAFAAEHAEDEAVARYSWAGVTGMLTPARRAACADGEEPVEGWGDVVSPFLTTQYNLNGGAFAATDGLIPVESAKWGRFRGCITADHLDQIGQVAGLTGAFDHRAFYEGIAGFLASQGH